MNDLVDLKRLAERAPTPRISGDLWQQGRRMRRRRHVRRAMACLAVLAIAVTPAWLMTRPVTRPAADLVAGAGDVVLPRGFARPNVWQATIDASPNGPVKLVFMHSDNIGFESGPVFIGSDNSYRVLVGSPPQGIGEISPDGRWLVHRHHNGKWELLDTVEGTARDLGLPIGGNRAALAWSRDSKYVLIKVNGGDVLDQPSNPDELLIYEVATGAKQPLLTERDIGNYGGFSPSGDRVAITIGNDYRPHKLLILDVRSGARLLEIPLAAGQRLVGPATWSPDAHSVTLATDTAEPNRWRLQYVDVATAEVVDDPHLRSGLASTRLMGWRDGAPVVAWETPFPQLRIVLIRLLPTGGSETLLELPPGSHDLLVPQDLVEQAQFGGPPISPSILPAQNWAYISVLVAVAMVAAPVLLIMWVVHRRRRRVRNPMAGTA